MSSAPARRLTPAVATFFSCLLVVSITSPGRAEDKPADKPKAKIESVVEQKGGKPEGHFNDTVVVTVANAPKGKDVSKWVIHLNRIPFRGQHPKNADFATTGELVFDLAWPEKTDPDYPANKAAWVDLLGGLNDRRPVHVAVGPAEKVDEDIDPLEAKETKHFTLDAQPISRMIAYCVFLVALLAALVWLARNSNLLRDPGVEAPPGKKRPYSLALTQMAFWFFLVVCGYLYIGFITFNFIGTVTAPILILLGISAGTGLAAVFIDSEKDRKRRELTDEQVKKELYCATLWERQKAATGAEKSALASEERTTTQRVTEIVTTLQTLPSGKDESKTFFTDLISDADGVSLHRFQIVIWTLVLGVVFVVRVIQNLSMPEFDTVLLTLMGISSGTYLGFKFPEKKTDPPPPGSVTTTIPAARPVAAPVVEAPAKSEVKK